ncbi:hypothetical protein QU617_09905 [Pseudomonas guariconensis]|uniref:hypothetical protein n=1 Tax=Pseudomonas guariconensis TaxID=1288410 RepID=UPI0025A955B3|nr:hypothetical protein [Pseudomonas guariconensis]MDM9593624.1 hypothetical protein [Pseudomonas guariconensis]MDM9606451.1 hypothetical protein [Pseudomonas guariconensis]MDM9611407.1 hypothetical protein [Pseudomonas guariconensis]
MASVTARIVCRHRWWLRFCLAGVLAIAQMTGREPCPERLSYWVGRGIKIEVHPE